MKPLVEFCSIDAKDDAMCRYNPVAFVDAHGPLRLGPKNGKQAILMQREYLVRLRRLQECIRKKYIARFNENEPPLDSTAQEWVNGITSEEAYKKALAEARKMFPGEEASYYT